MEIIERYIYAVTKELPESSKEDVAKELRANIEDMLPEHYEEKDVINVLQELGNPWKLAEEYQPNQRYLIGPAYYGKYISVLKLVLSIFLPIMVLVTFLGLLFSNPELNVTTDLSIIIQQVITNGIGVVIEAGLQVALWVTLVFVVLERKLLEKSPVKGLIKSNDENWSIKDLPHLAPDNKKIKRSSTISSMCWMILTASVLYFQPQLIAIYINLGSNGNAQVIPLLNTDRLQHFMPFFLILVLFQMIIFIWKYIVQYWNKTLIRVQLVFNVLMGGLLVWMLNDSALISADFKNGNAFINLKDAPGFIRNGNNTIMILTILVIVITIWECVSLLIKKQKK